MLEADPELSGRAVEHRAEIGVVGAGILGLAHAYAAARRGRRVVVVERDTRACGASVRNFGLAWPIGQPHSAMYEMALASRAQWIEILNDACLPYWPDGSLHVVYREDEAAVAREFAELAPALGYQSLVGKRGRHFGSLSGGAPPRTAEAHPASVSRWA